MIAGLRELGKTVFLTTHYMDEAQRLADRVTIIAGGEIVARGTPEDLGDRDNQPATIRYRGRRAARSRSRRRRLVQTLHELTGEALARGEELEGLEVTRPTLEDVYLELTERRGGGRVSLVLHQFRYDQKAFWRNPAAVFFTVMFPVVLLLIFATVFGGKTVDVDGGIKTTTYYVPAIITLSVISATMQSLAMSLVIAREDGRLKRGRGTPMPAWVFIAGRIGNSIVVALMMLALLARDRRRPLLGADPLGAAAGAPRHAGRSAPPPSAASASP